MNVYAHFKQSEIDGFQYRWRTLLRFGTSWDILGSVVMKNPGSAMPTNITLTDQEKLELQQFDGKNDQWYVFTSDNTMQLIEKLFIAKNKGKTLDGVIQIFNLFNIRNADLEQALLSEKKSLETINNTTDEDIEAMRVSKAPVYLGWGGLGSNPKFIQAAKKIFSFVFEELEQKYLWQEFADNSFYHPQYLMGRGKNRPRAQWLLQAFCENKTDIQCQYTNIAQKLKINHLELISEAKNILSQNEKCQWYEEKRLKFCTCLQATFDKSSLNIRFFYPAFGKNFAIANYTSIQERNIIDIIIQEYGFNGTEGSWIGRKAYLEYGNDIETIVNAIKEELASIAENAIVKGFLPKENGEH